MIAIERLHYRAIPRGLISRAIADIGPAATGEPYELVLPMNRLFMRASALRDSVGGTSALRHSWLWRNWGEGGGHLGVVAGEPLQGALKVV